MIELYFKHKRKYKILVCSEPIYLDIETSHKGEKCWMVTGQLYFAGTYTVVRTPSELMEYLLEKVETFALGKDEDTDTTRQIIVYIHNASYDLSYLLPWIQSFIPGYEDRRGIYDGRNKIITYKQGPFDFRCTYLLSSCSLERWCEEMNADHKKQVGLYDYNRILYQDSNIDEHSQIYDKYDVLSMYDCLNKQLEAYDDDLTTIPLTSTGYIRRAMRNATVADQNYRNDYFTPTKLDAAAYDVVLPSYSGGYTHNNRFLKGRTIRGNLKHKDFRSHYPTQIRIGPLPWGSAELFYTINDADNYRQIYGHYMNIEHLFNMWPEFTTISVIKIKDMRLKDPKCSMPFMQNSKMFNKSPGFRTLNDNGRSLATYGEFTTEIDNLTLKIISEQYDFEYKILKVYRFRNKETPKPIADLIDDLFKKKSDYKIQYQRCRKKHGEFAEETIEALFELNQTKKLLNAIYGCMATAPVRTEDDVDYISYYNGDIEDPYTSKRANTLEEKQEQLDKYYNSRNSFLPYQCGVMVTSLARYELYEYIKAIGYEYILYCDTDSAFYISTPENEKRIEALNALKHSKAPHIVDIKGNEIYYDVFEAEPDLIAFKGLHSKCYAAIDSSGELSATIAGVPRRTLIGMRDGAPIYLTREEELSGITKEMKLENPDIEVDAEAAIENLRDGFKFYTNTGFTAKYVHEKPHVEMIDGHQIETSGGCIIKKLDVKEIHDMNFIDYDFIFSDMYVEGL